MDTCFGKGSNCHLLPISETKLKTFSGYKHLIIRIHLQTSCYVLNRTEIHQISPVYCFQPSVELEFQPNRESRDESSL